MLHELQEPSGGSDVYVAAHLEELSLVFVAYAAVEYSDMETLDLGAEDHGILGYLLCKFPCGCDYQTRGILSLFPVSEVFFQKSDDVDSGLSASRL